jgi:hypothetical protein
MQQPQNPAGGFSKANNRDRGATSSLLLITYISTQRTLLLVVFPRLLPLELLVAEVEYLRQHVGKLLVRVACHLQVAW